MGESQSRISGPADHGGDAGTAQPLYGQRERSVVFLGDRDYPAERGAGGKAGSAGCGNAETFGSDTDCCGTRLCAHGIYAHDPGVGAGTGMSYE